MEQSLETINQIMIATSALSVASSAYMIYSILICKDLLKRPSFQIFMNMAVSNLLAASGTVFGGTPPNGSGACWWQGLSTNVFPLATFFWNIALLVILYNSCKLYYLNMTALTIICWGIPLFVSLIPLADSTVYGREDGEWCFLIPTASSNISDEMLAVWYWISFYLWMWLSFIFGCFILYYLNFNFIFSFSGPTRVLMAEKLQIIKFFPLVSLLSWGLCDFTDTVLLVAPDTYVPGIVNTMADALACLHGFFITIVFLYSTRETRALKKSPNGVRIVQVVSNSNPNSVHSSTFNIQSYHKQISGLRRNLSATAFPPQCVVPIPCEDNNHVQPLSRSKSGAQLSSHHLVSPHGHALHVQPSFNRMLLTQQSSHLQPIVSRSNSLANTVTMIETPPPIIGQANSITMMESPPPVIGTQPERKTRSFMLTTQKGSFFHDLTENDYKRLRECVDEESDMGGEDHSTVNNDKTNKTESTKLEELVINLLSIF